MICKRIQNSKLQENPESQFSELRSKINEQKEYLQKT